MHKTKDLFLLLPPKVRDMRLVFLVPKRLTIRALCVRIQSLLELKHPPRFRLCKSDGLGQGDRLEDEKTLGESESKVDPKDGLLHVVLDMSRS